MTDQMTQSDLKMAQLYNQLVSSGVITDRKYLNIKVIRPIADLQLSSLSFDNATIKKLIQQGYQEASQQYK